MMKLVSIVCALLLVGATFCRAQNESYAEGFSTGVYGTGGALRGGGGYLSLYSAGSFRRVLNPGMSFDLGLVGPTPKSQADGVFSFNYQTSYLLHPGRDRVYKPGLLYLTGGYSGFFTNGNGVNYGGGLAWRLPRSESQFSIVSLEYREYYIPGWGRQPGVRLAFGVGGSTQ